MNNQLRKEVMHLQESRDKFVKNDSWIVNVWFSTRQQLMNLLSKHANGWETASYLLADSISKPQWLEIASQALWLMERVNTKTTTILQHCDYRDVSKLPDIEDITDLDFQNLFRQYNQKPYINYNLIIEDIWALEAYKLVANTLARKQYIEDNISNSIIVSPSLHPTVNSIYTWWDVEKRVNRNNLFVRVDYNNS